MQLPSEESSAEGAAPFDARQLVRGTLRSPAEPLIDAARLQRSLYRGLSLGAALAPIGAAVAGLQGAINCFLFGLIATPVAWVEFWAERRPGSANNDALAGLLAALIAALALCAVCLQALYVEAILEGQGVAGFARKLDRVRVLDLWFVLGPSSLIVGGSYGASVVRRLRRYLPREQRRDIPAWGVILLGVGGTLSLAFFLSLFRRGALLFCPLLGGVIAYQLLLSVLGYVYRAADTLELELRLWRERRADP